MNEEDVLTENVCIFLSDYLRLARKSVSINSRLLQDLGVDGDDAADVLAAFSKKFNVDLSGLELSRHFGPEASFNPLTWLGQLLTRGRSKPITITVKDLVISARRGRWAKSGTDG